jgi:hypothetical protein
MAEVAPETDLLFANKKQLVECNLEPIGPPRITHSTNGNFFLSFRWLMERSGDAE